MLTDVRAGCFFHKNDAYVALPLKTGYKDKLDRVLLKLKNIVRTY